MAQAAHAIGGDDVDQRLPVPQTADELEELGQSFNALLDRLRVSFERQRRFTGDASHQLRTPLTALQGQVDLALRQERDVEEYRRVLGVVQRKTRQLRQIVESLLFLARADHETLGPLLERIDLAAWLAEHLRAWRESRNGPEPRPDLALEPGGTEGPLPVRVQPVLLAELVNNLLDNAARYSDPGSPIRVGLRRAGPAAELSVEDRGIGIADDEIPHLFEPFYRSPEARRRAPRGWGWACPWPRGWPRRSAGPSPSRADTARAAGSRSGCPWIGSRRTIQALVPCARTKPRRPRRSRRRACFNLAGWVKKSFGHALHLAQMGSKAIHAKPMQGFHGRARNDERAHRDPPEQRQRVR